MNMACEQRLRTVNQKTQLLRLPTEVHTEQQSVLVVKKLLAIAVSTITYLRGLFPEKAYGSKYVEERKVLILRNEHSCPGAKEIVEWMNGCFDALQKKYLHIVRFTIYTDPENPQSVTECYQFKIQYNEKGPQMDFESTNNKRVSKMSFDIKRSSILLVRKLYCLLQYLGPLPDSVCLSMSLAYHDHVTPQDYQPPGFKEGSSDSITFENEPVNLTMGEVITPFHTFKMDLTTERQRLEVINEDRDRLAVKMSEEQEEILSSTAQQRCILNDSEEAKNEVTMENSEKISYQRKNKLCEERLDNSQVSQMESVTRTTAELEVTTRRTRTGHLRRSSVEKTGGTTKPRKAKKETKSAQCKGMSQMEFPLSQDLQPNNPKKRKFSEPEEC